MCDYFIPAEAVNLENDDYKNKGICVLTPTVKVVYKSSTPSYQKTLVELPIVSSDIECKDCLYNTKNHR